MVKSGKLNSTIIEKNGKSQTYILLDKEREEEVKKSIIHHDEKDIKGLNKEIRLLKQEVAKLKEKIEQLSKN
jgi:predicted RNase H-like nuclease (RuvC/YqgF family)